MPGHNQLLHPSYASSALRQQHRGAHGAAILRLQRIAILPLLCILSAQAQDKPSAVANVRAGILLMQTRNFAEAGNKFSEAIRLDPHASDAMVWRGICENELKHYQAAAADFRAALRVDPNAQSAHYNLALSLLRLEKADEAMHELEIVTRANPSAVEAQYNLALLLEKQERYAEAREHLAAALSARPADVGATQHLLIDDLMLQRQSEADELLQHLAADTTPPAVQLDAGSRLLRLGYFSQAATLLEAAQRRLPAARETDLLLARAYIGSQEDFQAIRLLKAEPSDPSGETPYLLGLAYVSAGALQEAAQAFHDAVAANPHDARSLYQLGMLTERDGSEHRAEAVDDLRQAVRWEPTNAAYSMALGRMLLESDKPAEALQVLQHVHPESADEAMHTLLLGIAQAATEGISIAQPTLIRAVQLAPASALAHNVLGFCYFSEGHYAEAAAAYRQASDLLPTNDTFAYDAALAYERAGASADGLTYAQRAAALPSSRGEDHFLLGKLYLQTKDRDAAIRELKIAVQMNPELESPCYLLARTYTQMGDSAQASEWSKRLALLKQKHDPSAESGMGSAATAAMPSSRLLQGATVSANDAKDGAH